jgi:hypothetical protein
MQHFEAFCRTIVDLIFLDRLRALKDGDATMNLKLVPEVLLSMEREGLTISGRADWCLGHGNVKDGSESALVILYVFARLIATDSLIWLNKGSEKAWVRTARASPAHNLSCLGSADEKGEPQNEYLGIWFNNGLP